MTRTCEVDGCGRPHYARGWCNMHWARWRRTGTVEQKYGGTCSIDGCDSPVYGRGWCNKHYARWKRTGTTADPTRPNAEQRFWGKVDKSGECWLWTASLNGYGYGQFSPVRDRNVLAHRYSYELSVGPIPEGLQLDHLCRVRNCVNPAHLEPVTPAVNTQRSDAGITWRSKTHCPQGHPYDEANTKVNKKTGHRLCRACNRDYMRRRKAAQRAAKET